ncbi:MAG: B12-binding domain-containing radical SAM protein, partial [Promethearchaeota archaeon]
MRIVFIFPNTRRYSVFYPSIIQPPLGLGYLVAITKDDHDVMVIDAAVENLGFKEIFKRIERFKPDVIGITTNISIAFVACELSLRIKLRFKGLKIIMGGPWATSNYSYLLMHKIADIVVLGEGELVLKELLARLENQDDISNINGIAYLDNTNKVQVNPSKGFIEDLDALPYPAWEYFPDSRRYFNHYRHRPVYPIMITRGCPFNCIHCTKIVHGYKIRKRSVENVIGEIKYLIERFNAKEILIIDDNFTFDVEYAEAILDAIRENKIAVHIYLPNGVRADTLSTQLLGKMKNAGVYGFAIGVESGVQSIVNKIGKRLDLNKVRYAAKMAKKYKFLLRAFFILGLPYDSFDSMRHTIRFAKEIDPHFAYFFIATLFPGTKMYDIVKEMGDIDSSTMTGDKRNPELAAHVGFYYKPVINFSFGRLKP